MRSPHLRWHVSTFVVLLAISMSLAFVAGCSPNAAGPNEDNTIQHKLDWLTVYNEQDNANKGPVPQGFSPVLVDTVLSGLFDEKGGYLALSHDRDRIQFTFPAGAVQQPTLITIHVTEVASPLGSFWLLDCGPEGTVFARPVTVTVAPTSGRVPVTLFYFDEEAGVWVVQESTVLGQPGAGLHIYHFSRYGIS